MARREQFCDVCQKQIFNGHLARHKKRQRCDAARSRPSSTQVEHSMRVSDILVACGLDPEQLSGWNFEQLNKLPNIRNCRLAPHRHHTPWRVISDARLQDLPSLEDLLVNVARGARKNAALTVTTEVWQEDHRLDYAPAEWVAWTKRILKGEEVLSRMLNMPMGHMITADTSQQYRSAAAQLAACYFGTREAPDIRHHQATANITPRGTRTEVHHDSQPHISTAIGLASRKGSPLKLWLLWPSTELRHLAACYSDTKTALRQMDHGAFLVQMPGDSVVVPPNSPHAVIALESCYLYGHTFSIDSWTHDPSAILVDIKAGEPVEKACQERIERLRRGLRCSKFRQACIDQFIETWAIEAPIVRSRTAQLEDLVALWSKDIHESGSCAWCVAVSGTRPLHVGMDSVRHARAHLDGRMPAE